MKILLATPLYPPDSGGPAMEAALVHEELPKQGIAVEVCTFGSVRHLPRGIRHLRYFFNLLIHVRKVNVVVAIDTFSVCIPAAVVAHLFHKPFVVRAPGEFAWEQATQRFGVTDTIEVFQKKRYGLAVEFIRFLQRRAMKSATLVVVCSDFLKSIVAQWGIDPKRLVRIYLGLNFNEKVTVPSQIPEGKILFSLGRFVPWKGFSFLIELLPSLSKEWHLVIVGDGPLRSALQTQVQNLGVSNRVTFTGTLSRPEVLGWYRKADVFVLNTAQENFSFQVLEAMVAGVPVITTSVGSIPELITNGIQGVLCTPNDKEAFLEAIVSTSTQLEVWRKRTEAAQRKAHEFSSVASMTAFAECIKKICA